MARLAARLGRSGVLDTLGIVAATAAVVALMLPLPCAVGVFR